MANLRFAQVITATVAFTAFSLAFAAGDAQRGARVFGACIACQSLQQDRHLAGPSLAGVRGGNAGSVETARADLIAFLKAVSEGKAARVPKLPALPDLNKASPDETAASIRHCRDSYFVTNGKGQTLAYWEFNLRFKTDTSPSGPAPGKPVMVGQGMRGDRAQVVFASPGEISRLIEER